MTTEEVRQLLVSLKGHIDDDYRASDDPEDETPGMCVTIASNDGHEWAYQAGYNSFTGACYHYKHWAVIYLYRNSNCLELARDAVGELRDLILEENE
jgi:hypothetical protein